MSDDNVKCGGRKRILEPINQSARNPAKPDEIVRVQQFVSCPGCPDCTPPLPSSRVSEERLGELRDAYDKARPLTDDTANALTELTTLRTAYDALASAREADARIVEVNPASLYITHIFDGEEVVRGGEDGQAWVATFGTYRSAFRFCEWAARAALAVPALATQKEPTP